MAPSDVAPFFLWRLTQLRTTKKKTGTKNNPSTTDNTTPPITAVPIAWRLAAPGPVHALSVCLLLAPAIPLLFMGQACAAVTPFLYFCDHSGAAAGLAEAVAAGRRQEFRYFAAFADPAARAGIPDPNALDTFLRSRLDPARCASPEGAAAWRRTQALLQLRRRWLVPRLKITGR